MDQNQPLTTQTILDNISASKSSEEMIKMKRILAMPDKKAADQETAYWFVSVIKDMRYKMHPSPPKAYLNYRISSAEEKREINKTKGFWLREDIHSYLDAKFSIKDKNDSNLEWLQWTKNNIPLGDEVTHQKLNEAITELQLRIKTEG